MIHFGKAIPNLVTEKIEGYYKSIDNTYVLIMISKILIQNSESYMGLDTRKPVFGSLRTTQAQTTLHIHAV